MDGQCVKYDTVHVSAQFLESTEVVIMSFQGHFQHHLGRPATREDLIGTRPVAHDPSKKRSHFVVVGTGAIHNGGTNASERRMPIMSEAERLRRKELRRRPKMMEWARALGLLVEDDGWTVVVPRRSRRSWGDDDEA